MRPGHPIACLLILLLIAGCSKPKPSEDSSANPANPVRENESTNSASPETSQPAPKEIQLEPLPTPNGEVGETFSIAQVMQAAHGNKLYKELFKESFDPKVAERVVMLYESLPQQTSPKGDAEDWTKRSTALLTAAKQVATGEEDGVKAFKKAVNCNSCHSRHKPD